MDESKSKPTEENPDSPNKIAEDTQIEPDGDLQEIAMQDLPECMKTALDSAGWTSLMPVQAKTIPYVRANRDMMVQSRTGSGKTGAFILPLLERLDPNKATCQALILVPTRELAQQVALEATSICKNSGFRNVAVYGGTGYRAQLDAFKEGAHIVIGTPGRILDHLIKGTLSLKNLNMLVFDEADKMLSMGFYPDMKSVQRYLPSTSFGAYMFSATFPPQVLRLAGEFMISPELLSLSEDNVHVADVEHVYYDAPAMQKERCLMRILEVENPVACIIFCNTKSEVHYVSEVLQRFGWDADELSADLNQTKRDNVLTRVREGNLRFLVCTDIAARGIDIPELSHVVQYQPPEDPEAYIHRAGRTGRAGAGGEAISIVSGMEFIELKRIATRFKIDMIKREVPTPEEVNTIVQQRVTAILEARLRACDTRRVKRIQRFLPLVQSLSENEDESQLLAMMLDDLYQETLHVSPPKPPLHGTSSNRNPSPKKSRPPRKKRTN